VTFNHGKKAQFTLEVTPVDLEPFKLPAEQ
jgi:hypothetical protein